MMDDSVGNDKSMVRQEGEYDDDEEKYGRQMEKTALMTCGVVMFASARLYQ